MSETGYQLIDFGRGRKLESFHGRVVDRPSPAADGSSSRTNRWCEVDSSFDSRKKRWDHRTPWPHDFVLDCGGFGMPLSPTPFGHVGVFPEQAPNWRWLQQTAPSDDTFSDTLTSRGLNLFGYTGASTMAMAVTGMGVAHVDAAKPNVAATKRAAAANDLGDHPIRFLVDDAAKFAAREVRRENSYHTVVLDPPAYGHAPGGKAWRLERDLWGLLDDCLKLFHPESFRLLLTGHSPQVGVPEVLDYLRVNVPNQLGVSPSALKDRLEYGRLELTDLAARSLDAGFFVRFSHRPR